VLSPNSTWLVMSRLDTTRHVQRVEPMHFGCVKLVEQHVSTRSTIANSTVSTRLTCQASGARQWRHQDFHPGGTTNMFTKAGIHHRDVYIKKYDKLAHLITHKMAWSFQRQVSVIYIKTVNNIPLPIIGVWEKITDNILCT